MGFRTVVMLSNDMAHQWDKDAELGRKIARAMSFVNSAKHDRNSRLDNYGTVVQCVHADTQTLAVLDGYTSFDVLSGRSWLPDEQSHDVALKLLKDAADKLGYRLVKKARR